MNASIQWSLRVILAALVALIGAGAASAQAILISYDMQSEPTPLQVLSLRPNVSQPVYFHLANTGLGVRKNVKVTLEQVSFDGKSKEISKATVDMIPVKKSAPIAFQGLGPAKGDGPWPKLDGPPYLLRFWVEEGKTRTKTDVPVTILEPRRYVKIRAAKFDSVSRRLSIKVGTDEVQDPPCVVELVLSPSVIPGLKPSKAGTFKQTLSKDNPEVELIASKIEFEGKGPPQNGRIYLTVDGYERAFLFQCTFADGTLRQLDDEMRARILANRYSPSSEKTTITLEVDAKSLQESDNDSPQRSFVDLKFARGDTGDFENVPGSPFPGFREQLIELKADEAAVLFRTKVKDRTVEINTEGINGKRAVQIRLLNANKEPISLSNEQNDLESPNNKVALFDENLVESLFARLKFDGPNKHVRGDLVLDSEPAKVVAFKNLPDLPKPEESFIPEVNVEERSSDQAPVRKVIFFLGDAGKEGKLPEKDKQVEAAFDATSKLWKAKEELTIPADQKGKLIVSVQTTTAAGIASIEKKAVTMWSPGLVPTKPDPAKILATIDGTLLRGELAQAGVEVVLKKAKATKDDEPVVVKSDENGKFQFLEVAPGTYVISARKNNTGASLVLPVPKGKEKVNAGELQMRAQ